ncbi:hypothetical protein ACFQO7_03080 [Catellatospora aurea]|uniref:Uncharacterized protein n=1 Tax=Catellatospora aurea TaxID=1337874 RepID=A0ABW2GQ09_9ACTN
MSMVEGPAQARRRAFSHAVAATTGVMLAGGAVWLLGLGSVDPARNDPADCVTDGCLSVADLTGPPGELPAADRVTAVFSGSIVGSWTLSDGPAAMTLPANTTSFNYSLVAACLGNGTLFVTASADDGSGVKLTVPCDGHMPPGASFPGTISEGGVSRQATAGPFRVVAYVEGRVEQAEFFALKHVASPSGAELSH